VIPVVSNIIADRLKSMLSIGSPNELLRKLSDFKHIVSEKYPNAIRLGLLSEISIGDSVIGVFTDGSNAISERRGAGVAVFSASSLLFEIGGEKARFVRKYVLTPDICFLILIPRFYVGTRANNIMKGMEFITTTYMIDNNNVDFAVLDGSYISTLLSARWGIEHLYRDVYGIFTKYLETQTDDARSAEQQFIDLCDTISDTTLKILRRDIFGDTNEPRKIVSTFLSSYVRNIEEILDSVDQKFSIPEEGEISLINFIAMFMETNFMMEGLRRLLSTARRKKVPLLWLNKEPESRILTKKLDHKLFRMFTDAFALDFSLDDGEYLMHTGQLEVPASGKYVTRRTGKKNNLRKATHSVIPEIADEVYGEYGLYGIIYVKYRDFVIQYTYPRNILGSDLDSRRNADSKALETVRILGYVSPVGYPEPMIHVHLHTVIREGLADVMADSFIRILDTRGVLSKIIKKFIGKSGRKLIGI